MGQFFHCTSAAPTRDDFVASDRFPTWQDSYAEIQAWELLGPLTVPISLIRSVQYSPAFPRRVSVRMTFMIHENYALIWPCGMDLEAVRKAIDPDYQSPVEPTNDTARGFEV